MLSPYERWQTQQALQAPVSRALAQVHDFAGAQRRAEDEREEERLAVLAALRTAAGLKGIPEVQR